jgi:hypothetical protein
MLRQIGPLTKK